MSKKPTQRDDNEPRRGRPAGAATEPTLPTLHLPPRCTKCGSTNREPFSRGICNVLEVDRDPHGQPCTHIVYRRARCADCGQMLMIRSYYNSPGRDWWQEDAEGPEK